MEASHSLRMHRRGMLLEEIAQESLVVHYEVKLEDTHLSGRHKDVLGKATIK